MIMIEKLAAYIATATNHPYGTSCFSYELPDEPDECIALLGKATAKDPVAQIDAATQNIQVVVRAGSNATAATLALACSTALNPANTDGEHTGFIEVFDNEFVYCYVYNEPVWQKSDQQGRKYFAFDISVTSTRQNT